MNKKNKLIWVCVCAMLISLPACRFFSDKNKAAVSTAADSKRKTQEAPDEVSGYYARWAGEAKRLFVKPAGIIERLRTESILKRFAPKPPAEVYDIGGGAGVYAFPLAKQGYAVHLIDYTPLHIEQAKKRMKETGIKLAECSVGDARKLKAKDKVADVVLFFGPLYHLQKKEDRMKALHEAHRILKPGGMFFAAAISRFAVILKCMSTGTSQYPALGKALTAMAKKSFKAGAFSSPKDGPGFFTDAYFHLPSEFKKEIQDAGFKNVKLFNVEGPSLFAKATLKEAVKDREKLEALLSLLQLVENEPSFMGATGHFIAIGKK